MGSVKRKESKFWGKVYVLHNLLFKLLYNTYQLIVFPQVQFCHCSLSVLIITQVWIAEQWLHFIPNMAALQGRDCYC